MERIYLPSMAKTWHNEGILRQWHVDEGAKLRSNMPLVTIQLDGQEVTFALRKGTRGIVLRKKTVAVGERVIINRTLALVGKKEEQIHPNWVQDTLPAYGAQRARRQLWMLLILLGVLLLGTFSHFLFLIGLFLYEAWIGPLPLVEATFTRFLPLIWTFLAIGSAVSYSSYKRLFSLHQPPMLRIRNKRQKTTRNPPSQKKRESR